MKRIKTKTRGPASHDWAFYLQATRRHCSGVFEAVELGEEARVSTLPCLGVLISGLCIKSLSDPAPYIHRLNLVKGSRRVIFPYFPALGALACNSANGGLRLMPWPISSPLHSGLQSPQKACFPDPTVAAPSSSAPGWFNTAHAELWPGCSHSTS